MNSNVPNTKPARGKTRNGYIIMMVIVIMVILIILSVGEMMLSYQARIRAVDFKAQTEAMLAAEAGYEKALFWMSRQPDILGSLQAGGGSGNIDFTTSHCRYQVSFLDYMGQRPVFKVAVVGTSGRPVFGRAVNVSVIQEVTGWAMGICQIPAGTSSTTSVNFVDGEIIDIPIHINDAKDNPDLIDIHIIGSPQFKRKVEMGESRKTSGGSDKYASVINCFQGGITFDQPYIRITDSTAVTSKLNRFCDSTNPSYRFTPVMPSCSSVTTPKDTAVQLEFFVQGGVGKVRITNNCLVKLASAGAQDYMITPGSNPVTYQKYNLYAYHFKENTNTPTTVAITDTYVTQTFGGYTSDPGGQIYVNGNVIIGGDDASSDDQVVQGKITVIATGNIWIADSIRVDGDHDANGMPLASNPNVLGLIAQGVIKVVDPGLTPTSVTTPTGFTYQAIGNKRNPVSSYPGRWLPDPTVVEAAMTVGGGGWGAENTPNRKVYSTPQDDLVVWGSISEAVRGIVGHLGSDGYVKKYHMDDRLKEGVLPGNIWFSGKYIPAPAGWQDSRCTP
jgi:hypothetical protein